MKTTPSVQKYFVAAWSLLNQILHSSALPRPAPLFHKLANAKALALLFGRK